MARDYNQGNGLAKIWQRSNEVIIRNPVEGIPSIAYMEEQAVKIENIPTLTTRLPSILVENLTDPNVKFPLVNPLNLEPLGKEATYGDVQVLLSSLYLHLAKLRDEAEAEAQQP